ncbi:nucleotide exchange factor GrpE [Seonamhaeicola maritimus]|uniref:Protein GrpE n=1 Tax=Seonamhaeicola maritimus TaxID=2591822 RepID=A0A5C7GM83_9FLAO|nr:nucleotide exchange factor GrpE [Seonamhaeicola maritimus]TXG39167.1 nucleotide exchange factor GrpE [Seonamhaeicola maritimus]
MSKKEKNADIEQEQVEAAQTETVEAEEQVQEPVEELTVEEKLQKEVQQEKEKFLRLFAEFENYKKRTSRERLELFKTASEEVMVALLPIIDDFERALTHIEEDKEAEELRKGVVLIYQKMLSTLEQKGLSAIKVEKGDAFNADDHEAVTQIPAPSEELKGKIIDVIEKGYKLGEKVIRFPKVVIGQ